MLGQVAGPSAPRDGHTWPTCNAEALWFSGAALRVSAWGVVHCWQLLAAERIALELWGNWGPSGLGFLWQARHEPWLM